MQENFIPTYLAVFAGCIGLLYIWPRVVFNKYLKGKSGYYQIFFCVSVVFVLCNIVITALALTGILTQASLCVAFYGVFAASLIWQIVQFVRKKEKVSNRASNWWKKYKVKFSKEYRKNPKNQNVWVEIALTVAIAVIVAMFLIHFVEYSSKAGRYGFSDMPRHDAMITQLMNGEFYNDGIYPYGMHYIILTICSVFNEPLFNVNMYIGSFACLLFFLALYCFLRSIFKSKITVIAVLALLLLVTTTLLYYDPNERMVYDAMHRYRYTIPQEFCYFAVFVAPICVKKLMETKESMKTPNNIALLILLGLSVGTTVCTHYYSLGFQIAFCLMIFVVNITKLKKEKFIAFVISSVSGLAAGAIPILFGLLRVGKFHYAIDWATTIPSGNAPIWHNLADVVKTEAEAPPAKSFYDDALGLLFHHDYVIPFLIFIGVGIAITIFYLVKKDKSALNFLAIDLCMIIFMALYSAPVLDVTQLIESHRVVMMLYITICMICCYLIDFVLSYKTETIYPNYQSALL